MSERRAESSPGWRVFPVLLMETAAFLLIQLIRLYLSWPKQPILGCASVLIGLAANRISSSRAVTIALMLISLTGLSVTAGGECGFLLIIFSTSRTTGSRWIPSSC